MVGGDLVFLKRKKFLGESEIIARWWFQIFFIFIPTWRNDPIWRAHFSNGWLNHQLDSDSMLWWAFGNGVLPFKLGFYWDPRRGGASRDRLSHPLPIFFSPFALHPLHHLLPMIPGGYLLPWTPTFGRRTWDETNAELSDHQELCLEGLAVEKIPSWNSVENLGKKHQLEILYIHNTQKHRCFLNFKSYFNLEFKKMPRFWVGGVIFLKIILTHPGGHLAIVGMLVTLKGPW